MCATCGCEDSENSVQFSVMGSETHTHSHVHDHFHEHAPNHDHTHVHSHEHGEAGHYHTHEVDLETDILQQNNLLAERNRGFFEALNIFAINLVSSPGSGKTTLLEKTIADLKNQLTIEVIEGDQQTSNDAERIYKLGVPTLQINTGKGCHLDSDMIAKSIKQLKPQANSLFLIENVGNLVCPAMFDLGENLRAVIVSVTEGEDKPIKYPDMFYSSQVCIINKIDLLPYLKFDMEQLKNYALQVNPNLKFFEVSAVTGEGMEKWYEYLKAQMANKA